MQTPQWMQTPPGHMTSDSCWEANLSTWTEGMTHACENITFPQLLLRAVKIGPRGRARP